MVEKRRFEILGDVIRGHRSNLKRPEQDRPTRRWMEIPLRVFLYAPDRRDGREWHAARMASRTPVRRRGRRCSAANCRLLYSACSRITWCLTRNNEVYNVQRNKRVEWPGGGHDLGRGGMRTAKARARNPAMSSKRQRHATCVIGRRGRRPEGLRLRYGGFAR